MKREVEHRIYTNALEDTKRILKRNNNIAIGYYDCWCYLNKLIEMVAYKASDWLLKELCMQRDYYQDKYLINRD